jgi:uncharacterized protein
MDKSATTVGGVAVAPGKRATVDLPIANLYTHTDLVMPVHVVNGRHAGPTLFVTAALHGDELNGVEIVKRLLGRISLRSLHGCILAVPIVNVFGFLNQSRYLPDRRDLNRSFPGRDGGSTSPITASTCTRRPSTGSTCRRYVATCPTPSYGAWPTPSARRWS